MSATWASAVVEANMQALIDEIEDYIGGNVEGVETIDRMALTVFLRARLQAACATGQREMRERAATVFELMPAPASAAVIRELRIEQ